MKHLVIAVKDTATQAFTAPTLQRNVNHAKRSFKDEVNRDDPNNQMFKHPGDYELWGLGTWDDETGLYEGTPELIERAKDVTDVGI